MKLLNFFLINFFDIQEEYYIYTKKYFGRANLYKYKQHLDLNIDILKYMDFINYYDE